jgi:hypothetical protein
MGEMKSEYKILVAQPKKERPLRRPTCRLEDIKMYPKEIGCGLDSSGSA